MTEKADLIVILNHRKVGITRPKLWKTPLAELTAIVGGITDEEKQLVTNWRETRIEKGFELLSIKLY